MAALAGEQQNNLHILLYLEEDKQEVVELNLNNNIEDSVKAIIEKYNMKPNLFHKFKSLIESHIKSETSRKKKDDYLRSISKTNHSVKRLYYDAVNQREVLNAKLKMEAMKSRTLSSECTFSPEINKTQALRKSWKDLKKTPKVEDHLNYIGQKVNEKKSILKLKQSIIIRDSLQKPRKITPPKKPKEVVPVKETVIHDEDAKIFSGNPLNDTPPVQEVKPLSQFSLREEKRRFSVAASLKSSERNYTTKFLKKLPDKEKLKILEKTATKYENYVTETQTQSQANVSMKRSNLMSISPFDITLSVKSTKYLKNEDTSKLVPLTLAFQSTNIDSKQNKDSLNRITVSPINSKLEQDIGCNKKRPSRNLIIEKLSIANTESKTVFTKKSAQKTVKQMSSSALSNDQKKMRSNSKNKSEKNKKSQKNVFDRLTRNKNQPLKCHSPQTYHTNLTTQNKEGNATQSRNTTPYYLQDRTSHDTVTKMLMTTLNEKKQTEELLKSSKFAIRRNNFKNFKMEYLKELYQKILDSVGNFDEIDLLYSLMIPKHIIEDLVKPACFIMKKNEMEFNFANFYTVAEEIINFLTN